MKYTHNYKNTKENLTVVGCLFFIGGIIALPFVGVTSIIAIVISFLFFWERSRVKCAHTQLYNSCSHCKQLFCVECHQNMGHFDSYTDEKGVVKPEYEDMLTGYFPHKVISGPDKPTGCGLFCTMCMDQLSKKDRKLLYVIENLFK